jgi:hypothetical protein
VKKYRGFGDGKWYQVQEAAKIFMSKEELISFFAHGPRLFPGTRGNHMAAFGL